MCHVSLFVFLIHVFSFSILFFFLFLFLCLSVCFLVLFLFIFLRVVDFILFTFVHDAKNKRENGTTRVEKDRTKHKKQPNKQFTNS